MTSEGKISNYVDIVQGVAQGCTLSPNLFKVHIDDMIVAVILSNQGVTMREDTAFRLIFAEKIVGISETPEELLDRRGTRAYSKK